MTPADQNSLHRLLSAVVDGTATQADMDELSAILAKSAEARQFYIRYLDMHAELASGHGFETKQPRRLPWVAAIASGLFAASLALALWPVRMSSTESPAGPRAYVATVAACTPEAKLNGEPVTVGMRLAPGRFQQKDGSVDVQFDGGAQILFDGSAAFTIESRQSIAIERATFVFRGNQTCESIDISTPHSLLTDIGTRYAAVVAPTAEELHVADGAVRRTTRDPLVTGGHELLETGEGRRYDPKAPRGADIPLDTKLVERSLAGAVPRGGEQRPFAWDDFRVAAPGLATSDSGAGWVEPWVRHQTFPDLKIAERGLGTDRSAAVLHDGAGWTAAHRRLQQPIDLSRDGVYYVRYLFRRGPRPPQDEEHLAMLVLRKYGLTTQQEIDAKSLLQFAVSSDDTATIRFAGRSSRSSLPQSPDHVYAAVAKIVAGRTNPDQVFLRIISADRLATAGEPVDWSVASESLETDFVLDQVSLEFVSSGRIEFDDLCIGPTWESVTRPLHDADASAALR